MSHSESAGAPSQRTDRGLDIAAGAVVVLVAAGYVLITLRHRAAVGAGIPSPDIYGQQYPMLTYFWRSLLDRHGFLWNSLQNCGEPVIPATPPGTLYPLNLVLLFFGLDAGYPAMAGLHLAVGGLSLYLLCREYGLPRAAGLAGAFAFELGEPLVHLSSWLPTTNLGAYVWMPAAVLLLERTLREPTLGRGLWLGVTLTLSLLAGFPQNTLFIYQVLALRIVWELFTTRLALQPRALGMIGVGLALPVFLGAVQLLPSLELVRLSVRPVGLSAKEMEPAPINPWEGFRGALQWRLFDLPVFTMGSVTLGALAWLLPGRRRMAIFYGIVLAIYIALMLQTPLVDLYHALPLGRLFRFAWRFYWPAWFAACVLVALGTGALVAGGATPAAERPGHAHRRLALPALVVTAGAGLRSLVSDMPPWELITFAAVLALAVWAGLRPGVRAGRGVCASALVLVSLWQAASHPFLRFLPDASPLTRRQAAFDVVRRVITPQDRLFVHAGTWDASLMHKSGSLFGLPVASDYEPQTPRRFAEFWVKMVLDRKLEDINQYNLAIDALPAGHPLMNMLAARFILLSDTFPDPKTSLPAGNVPIGPVAGTWIVVNWNALPRAYFVPRVQVVPDPDTLLDRLASPTHRPREIALVEETPADGFLGAESPGDQRAAPAPTGTVTLDDRSELVTLRVTSDGPGFVVLTDQYYPGWVADVNGEPAPILRANYAFRAVHVPGGESVVRFRYRPSSFYGGLAITVATSVAILSIALTLRWRRRAR